MTVELDWMQPPAPIRIGISSCLLGEPVRFDGQHKRDAYIVSTLGTWFTFVPVCPELAVGLGVPREPIRLMEAPGGRVQAAGMRTPGLDPSAALAAFGRRMATELDDLSGYLFKSGSPSCGMARVKVYRPQGGAPAKRGVGLYAAEILAARPELPAEEEGRLGDPVLRENFIERVYAYHRWRALCAAGATATRLMAFHGAHKLALMAHGPAPARRLGRLVAEAGRRPSAAQVAAYGRDFQAALRRPATRRGHTNVLQHLAGYLKRVLDPEDRAELAEQIHAYRSGEAPLLVPLTLLRHHFRRHPDPYVAGQTYLAPHPRELLLRHGL